MQPSLLADEELMRQIRMGNGRAFKTLYERHWYNLYSRAFSKLQRQDVAEELVQDIFLKLWCKRTELLIGNVGAFLTTSLRNAIIDYIREQKHEMQHIADLQHFLQTVHHQADDSLNADELAQQIRLALQQLPLKTRDVFELSRFEQLTTREISQRLSLTDKAIEYHLTKALRHLRAYLKEYTLLLTWLIGNL